MNLPNKLTLLRIILTFIFMPLLFLPDVWAKLGALAVFTLASLTDFYDGRIARKKNQITSFGKLMDPIADKILILSALLAFVQMQLVSAWMVVLIMSREIIITGVRMLAMTKGKVLAAEAAGKHKTVSQMVAIFAILLFLLLREIMFKLAMWPQHWERYFSIGIWLLMIVTVGLTLVSGISFLWRQKNLWLNA
ncbi:MAG: CDP-diacylglycerol--glycerol-3-phosphate 3-phosphatidyltransferase [Candidatus Omnitrophota bacterium]